MSALDPLIHAPARLQLCAILAAVDEAQFSVLREELDVSDSVLSKHLSALSDEGYVRIRKEILGRQRATWVSLTPTGSRAFAGHVAALRALIDAPAPALVSVPVEAHAVSTSAAREHTPRTAER